MKAKSKKEAWAKVDAIFPTDYIKDEARSGRAGYDIYRSTLDSANDWISDLGDRLEVNFENGETVNIWFEQKPKFREYQLADALEVISEAIYTIDDNVDRKLAEVTGIKEAKNKLYGAYREIAEILREQHPGSDLYEKYNLQES